MDAEQEKVWELLNMTPEQHRHKQLLDYYLALIDKNIAEQVLNHDLTTKRMIDYEDR